MTSATEKFSMLDSPLISGEEKHISKVEVVWEIDEDADLSYLDQFELATEEEERDYYKADQARKREFGGRWWMLGCLARARCLIGVGGGVAQVQTFASGGLWGIESDSGEDYLRGVEQEELESLRGYLELWGFETEVVERAFAQAEVEGR